MITTLGSIANSISGTPQTPAVPLRLQSVEVDLVSGLLRQAGQTSGFSEGGSEALQAVETIRALPLETRWATMQRFNRSYPHVVARRLHTVAEQTGSWEGLSGYQRGDLFYPEELDALDRLDALVSDPEKKEKRLLELLDGEASRENRREIVKRLRRIRGINPDALAAAHTRSMIGKIKAATQVRGPRLDADEEAWLRKLDAQANKRGKIGILRLLRTMGTDADRETLVARLYEMRGLATDVDGKSERERLTLLQKVVKVYDGLNVSLKHLLGAEFSGYMMLERLVGWSDWEETVAWFLASASDDHHQVERRIGRLVDFDMTLFMSAFVFRDLLTLKAGVLVARPEVETTAKNASSAFASLLGTNTLTIREWGSALERHWVETIHDRFGLSEGFLGRINSGDAGKYVPRLQIQPERGPLQMTWLLDKDHTLELGREWRGLRPPAEAGSSAV